MSTGELVNLLFLAFVSAGLGVAFWRRLSEIRTELKEDIAVLRADLTGDVTALRTESVALRTELRAESAALRSELKEEIAGLRQEMAIMRSDLTQVALAVGVRPRASND